MTDQRLAQPRPDLSGLSVAELVSRASQQVSTLVRDELALARLELTEKGRRAGQGAGLFAAAGAIAFFGLGALVTTAIAALSVVWPVWLAALVVTVVLFLIAGSAVLIGRSRLRAATPFTPAEAQRSVTEDVATIRTALHEGRAPNGPPAHHAPAHNGGRPNQGRSHDDH